MKYRNARASLSDGSGDMSGKACCLFYSEKKTVVVVVVV